MLTTEQRIKNLESRINDITIPGTSRLTLKNPEISEPKYKDSALWTLFFGRDTFQSIATAGPNVVVTFEASQDKNFGSYFSMSDDHTKILLERNIDRPFQINGTTVWAANATGYRSVSVELFDVNDVSLGAQVLYTVPGMATTENCFPISFKQWFPASGLCSYVKFTVSQNSGGNLNFKCVLGLGVA